MPFTRRRCKHTNDAPRSRQRELAGLDAARASGLDFVWRPMPAPLTIYAFGDFELDQRLYELRCAGRPIKIEPKVFDVLAYLLAHSERVVSKDELLEALWPGEFVSESVLPRCMTAARKALGDDPSAQRMIQTVHGRGYRFVAPVRVVAQATPQARDETAVSGSTSPADEPADARAEDGVKTSGTAQREPVFVGRESAMEALGAALDDALAGQGRLVLVVGEPGIGKTRTAEELALAARKKGARVLAGRSYEAAGAPAFWPWVQILRAYFKSSVDPAAALRAANAPELAQLIPDLATADDEAGRTHSAAPDALAPEQARFRLFDGAAAFFRNAAQTEPIVFLLDDLHWADKASLLLLQFLAREVRDARMLIVGTYRDVELRRQHPLGAVLAELAREPACSRVVLRGLSESEVGRYMEASTTHAPDAALVSAVHEMTEGNPFFVGEIVRLLAAEGRLDRRDQGLAGLALPQGVREAVGRRLDALSDQCNQLLPVAAVIGRDFPLSVLERVAALPRTHILELLDEAASARVLNRPASALASYGFSHALIRETLYEELTTPVRVRLHRRVGEELEQLHGADAGMHLAEIAHHFFQAAPGGDVDKAVHYCVRAAERATALLAYEEAAVHYERALQALELDPRGSSMDRGEVLLALGDAQSCSGERDKARATFERAAAYARAAGRADQLARAALGFGGRGEMGMPRDEPLRALLVEALEALGDGADELRSTLLARLVGTAPYYESLAKRMAFSAESLALARRSGDEATLMKALAARGWAFLGPDHVAARLEVATELLAIAEQAGDKQWEFIGREYRQGIYLALGDMQAVDREIAAAERLSEEIRQPISRWFARWWKASRALCDGRFEEADRLRHEALAIGQSIQHPGAMAIFAGQGLWLAYERGGTQTIFEDGFEFLLSYYPRATVALRAGEAMYYCLTDRMPEARACFDALAAEDFADIPRDEHWISSISGIAEVCALLGDTKRAATLYALLLPFADRNCVHDLLRAYSGSAAHYLALLAACRGDLPAATAHFESALAMNKRMAAQPYVGRTLYEYARILLEKGGPKDRSRAATLLDECSAVSGAIGLGALQTKARALRESAERPR